MRESATPYAEMGHPPALQRVENFRIVPEIQSQSETASSAASAAAEASQAASGLPYPTAGPGWIPVEDLRSRSTVPFVIGEQTMINDSPLAQSMIFSTEFHPKNHGVFIWNVPL